MEDLSHLLTWLKEFSEARGRPLRALHVGNVANNAFLVGKLLRKVGVEIDVLSYDYYHMMATPEWEELDIRHEWGDDNFPHFSSADTEGYQRPDWFVQGPLSLCVAYLLARARGLTDEAANRWNDLELHRLGRPCSPGTKRTPDPSNEVSGRERRFHIRRLLSRNVGLPFRSAQLIWRFGLATMNRVGLNSGADGIKKYIHKSDLASKFSLWTAAAQATIDPPPYLDRFRNLTIDFAKTFPDRADRLTLSDLVRYSWAAERLEEVFQEYDIVQGYGIEPILPLLCGTRPYVAFEHGTLRDFVRGDNLIHRLNALAYRRADHVFVTNGDCIEHARWLGCDQASAMLHPVDIEQHERRDKRQPLALRRHYGADVLLFCPIRHDWAVKGTDIHIRALPELRERIPGRVVLLLAPWGQQVEDSRRLAAELGCTDSIVWLERPLCRLHLVRHMQAADAVLDQMALPHFGATAPQALAAGTPVIMSYRPESTAWIVGEPAPILSAFDPNGVVEAVLRAIDPVWRAAFTERARVWIDSQHHHDRLVRDHLAVYRALTEKLGDK
jgi:glycosyltransferase involved in cell wall biosynthesis